MPNAYEIARNASQRSDGHLFQRLINLKDAQRIKESSVRYSYRESELNGLVTSTALWNDIENNDHNPNLDYIGHTKRWIIDTDFSSNKNRTESLFESYKKILTEYYPPDPIVYQFLQDKWERLLPHLLDAPKAIKAIFGEKARTSWYVFDAGDPSSPQLVLVIRSDHPAEEAVRLQDRFFDEWFTPRINKIWPDLTFTEEFYEF